MVESATNEFSGGQITDAGILEMRSQIGITETIAPWISSASEDAIWHFALGIGDDNPLWWDRAYADTTPVGRMFAMPTLLYAVTSDVVKPRDEVQPSGVEAWLPGALGLWAGDRWKWHSRVWVDERLSATRELYSVREFPGKSGRSVAQTERVIFYGQDDRVIAEQYRTILRFESGSRRENNQNFDVPEPRYSDEERRMILDHYASEPTRRRGAVTRYWEDVRIGDELPTLVKGPLSITNLVGFQLGWGSPQCPTNRMLYQWLDKHPGGRLYNSNTGIDDTLAGAHWDTHFAREGGMARGYDFGAQRITWLGHVLTDWCGDEGELVELDARLRAPNYIGDTTWLGGQVTDKQRTARGALVSCDLTGTNQRSEATVRATAVIALPQRGTD